MLPVLAYGQSLEINLNDTVFVELSELGRRILRRYLEDVDYNIHRHHSDMPWYRTPEQQFDAWPQDAQGRHRFQLYQLMAIFGPHTPDCATSVDLPFESMNAIVVKL